MKHATLIHRYLLGDVTEEDVRKLDRLLKEDSELRREFVFAATTDANLREVAFERAVEPAKRPPQVHTPKSNRRLWGTLGVVVAVLLLIAVRPLFFRPETVATLDSSEDAAWESSLPTLPGSQLAPGLLHLKSGIATIRFDSGAEVVLEAPAELELLTPMRTKLLSGSAVIEVPEAAIGFVVDTPSGYAVDHGTQFAVRVGEDNTSTEFEVIEGEISVYHPLTNRSARLGQRQAATTTRHDLTVFKDIPQETFDAAPKVLRIGTNGRASTFLRNGKHDRIPREMLQVKNAPSANWDRRAVFSFDLSKVDLADVRSARLRLNQVPSGKGHAARMPLVSTFAVYGLTDPTKKNWRYTDSWEKAPGPDDGTLLGRFEIPRSQQQGNVGIKTATLLNFLRSKSGAIVTLILVRETSVIEGEGRSLVHAFASDTHPEATGPKLEFSLSEEPTP